MKHYLQDVAAIASLMFMTASHQKQQTNAFVIPARRETSFPQTTLKSNYESLSKYSSIHSLQWNTLKRTASRETLSRPSSSHRQSSTELNGIPKMFRWLTDQYPNINSRLSEGLSSDKVVDNFYLDMNGIIHPCTHGNNSDEIIVLDETAMFKKIFGYVDR